MNTNYLITLPQNGNPEIGYLSFFETQNQIPFDIKRVYYTYGVPIDVKRGMHAHRKLKQLIWCPYGVVEVILDDGHVKKSFLLDSPNKALVVMKGFWRDLYWRKSDSVLCIAASDFYLETDYIRSYEEYLELAREGYWLDENKL